MAVSILASNISRKQIIAPTVAPYVVFMSEYVNASVLF